MLSRFVQKNVLITGGASGLGEAMVKQFAQLGWKIAVVDINLDGAKKVAEAANLLGASATAFYCDIGKDDDFIVIANTLKDAWGGLDIIINNAGIASVGMMVDVNPEQWHRIININLTSVYRGCHYWLPLLPENGPAHVVNTASFAGFAQAPGMMSYNVSKAGVISISESLRAELAYRNIGVSVVCPSFFKTNLLNSMDKASQSVKSQITKWMESSKVTADDVAHDVICGIENNELMVISHKKARNTYRFKRYFPKTYLKRVSEMASAIVARQKRSQRTKA